MSRPKRKYVRLSSSKWAELRAYWEAGDHSLAELSDQYGVSPRTIQSHLSKLGSIKGSKAAEMAAEVQKEIFKGELGERDTLVFRAKETREATLANAKIVEGLIMAQLQNAQKDPTQAFKATTALKALSLAASALERLHATKPRALGLDRENVVPDEMPVLTIRDLISSELEALRECDETEDEGELGDVSIVPEARADISGTEIDESDEIVVEGEEQQEPDETEETGKPSPDVPGSSRWEIGTWRAIALSMRGDFVSVGMMALSVEVPFILLCPDSHWLCVHDVFSRRNLRSIKPSAPKPMSLPLQRRVGICPAPITRQSVGGQTSNRLR